jgi:AcrR family transcriptional regulator
MLIQVRFITKQIKKTMSSGEKNKEQAILEAAEKEFLEKGFDAAKTTKICLLAGVTHAMLHYYYRTKENLFNMVFDRKINLMKESLHPLFYNPDLPLLERIKIGMEKHFDLVAANPDLPRFVMNELIVKPKRREMFEKKISNTAKQLIEQLQFEIDKEVERGTIQPIKAITLLLDIISLNIFVFAALPVLRLVCLSYYQHEREFLEERKKENVEIIMRRLKKI